MRRNSTAAVLAASVLLAACSTAPKKANRPRGNPLRKSALVALIAASFGGYGVGLVLEHLVKVTARKIDESADRILADEEAALHAALHPHAHAAHGHVAAEPAVVAAQPVVSKPSK